MTFQILKAQQVAPTTVSHKTCCCNMVLTSTTVVVVVIVQDRRVRTYMCETRLALTDAISIKLSKRAFDVVRRESWIG